MSFRADLALYDREGRLGAVAEVKNRPGNSPSWAAQTRRNILAHGALGRSDFFLLITPDRIYVWKDVGDEPIKVPASYEGESEPLFAPYFAGAGIAPDKATGQAFAMLVAVWLGDLTRRPDAEAARSEDWLDKSGLRAAALDGRVEHEADV